MTDPLRISVVTATYNRAGVLGEALASVRAQSWPHVEHVIQDGASSDSTAEILAAAAHPGLLVESAPDAGLYDAINRGIARATGDVVGLMHSDDVFAHDRVLERVAACFADPAVDGVYGDLDYVAVADTSRVIRRWRSGTYERRRLRRGWMPPHPTLYLRREVFERWGTYDTGLRIAADYDAMLRYLWTGGIHLTYLPEVMVKMRLGGASNASLRHILQKSREDYRALRRNGVGGAGALAWKNLSKLGQFRG